MAPQRRGLGHLAPAALGALLLAPNHVLAGPGSTGKKIFSHYMVGDSTTEHRQRDIDDAKAIGIDGFSLNIGKTDPAFVRESLNDLFDYAAGKDFGLHISMDLIAAGDDRGGQTKQSVPDYKQLLVDFFGHAAYEHGSNGFPIVTTFADGGTDNSTWDDWRNQFAQKVFLIPNLDRLPGYWEFHPGLWEHWGPVVDGLFSWESAWPERNGKGGDFPGDIGPDRPLMKGLAEKKKKYMIGLSPLQYKDAYDTNVYRNGGENLPTRMASILSLRDSIQYVNILTWNDGPESHYVGNLWPEQNSDKAPAKYMHLSHKGWQKLLGSFNAAFKGDGIMRPFGGDKVTGALWYKTILSDTECTKTTGAVGIDEQYLKKPEGYASAADNAYYAIVLPPGASGWKLRLSSGDKTETIDLKTGFDYGNAPLAKGVQRAEIVDASGSVVATASGGRCVYGGNTCPDCTYNVNPVVVEFTSGSAPADAKCDETCQVGNGADGYEDLPPETIEKICALDWDVQDLDVLRKTWVGSGASYWLQQFLYKNTASRWTDEFFKQTYNQGGSDWNCVGGGSDCDRPKGVKECKDYKPPQAFFVHEAIGGLHSGLEQVYDGMVTTGIETLSGEIDDIVEEYGTPAQDDNAMILNMFVGVLTSLTGIAGGIADAKDKPTLSKYAANPLTFLAGIFAQAAAAGGDTGVDPEDLKTSLRKSFGSMFTGVMQKLNTTRVALFDGELPEGMTELSAEDWIWKQFMDGEWLSYRVVNDVVNLFVENTQQRFKEFATVRAMKTENKESYRLMTSGDGCMTEAKCKEFEGAYFYKNRCLAFATMSPPSMTGSLPIQITGDSLATLRKYFPDINGGLANNLDCLLDWVNNLPDKCKGSGFYGIPADCHIPDPSVPTNEDLDLNDPMNYPKCFFNLPSTGWIGYTECKD